MAPPAAGLFALGVLECAAATNRHTDAPNKHAKHGRLLILMGWRARVSLCNATTGLVPLAQRRAPWRTSPAVGWLTCGRASSARPCRPQRPSWMVRARVPGAVAANAWGCCSVQALPWWACGGLAQSHLEAKHNKDRPDLYVRVGRAALPERCSPARPAQRAPPPQLAAPPARPHAHRYTHGREHPRQPRARVSPLTLLSPHPCCRPAARAARGALCRALQLQPGAVGAGRGRQRGGR